MSSAEPRAGDAWARSGRASVEATRCARVAGLLIGTLAAASGARPAQAADDFGTRDPAQQAVVYTMAVTSALGTLVTGVAAAVFAVRGEAFSTPWLVAALFSGGLTLGTGVSLLTFEDPASPVIGVALMLVSSWPLGYSVRSALNPDGFGRPLALRAPPGVRVSVPLLTVEF